MRNLTPMLIIMLAISIIISPLTSTARKSPTPAPEPDNLMSLSLEDLMGMDISLASKGGLSLRETPGIITVITEEEIKNSGARNMVDVLRLVPGIHINGHEESTLVLGIRGHAAQEGKVLVMIDGLQFNEGKSGGVVFGDRILPDNIHKIEIIRGPGSAIYGGLAGLAVINFVTKSAIELDNGGYISVTSGVSNQDQSRLAAQFGVGRNLSEDFGISLTGNASMSNLSNETVNTGFSRRIGYYSGGDSIYNYADSSQIQNIMLNLGTEFYGVKAKAIYQLYRHENTFDINDQYLGNDTITFAPIIEDRPEADYVDNSSIMTQLSYDWQVNDQIKITPTLAWKKQAGKGSRGGKQVKDDSYIQNHQVYNTYRTMANITAVANPTSWLSVTAGGEYYKDKLTRHHDADSAVVSYSQGSKNFTGKDEIEFYNVSTFSELLVKTEYANLVIGGRYDHHEEYGDAFVPRIAITSAIEQAHIKLLASRAFKAPVMDNILNDYGDNIYYNTIVGLQGERYERIEPEHINVLEAEVGFMPTSSVSLLANAYYTRIDDPIVSDISYYTNGVRLTTRGVELEARLKNNWGYVNATYSYYQNRNSQSDFILITDSSSYYQQIAYKDSLISIGQEEFIYEPDSTNQIYQTVETAHAGLLRGMPAHKFTLNAAFYIGDRFTIAPSYIFDSRKYEYTPGFDSETSQNIEVEYETDRTHIVNLSIHFHPSESIRFSISGFDLFNQRYKGAYTSNNSYFGTQTMGRELVFKASYSF